MKKTLILFCMFLFLLKVQAQDKKMKSLFDEKSYCKCIERFDNFTPDKKTPDDFLLKISAYYELFLTPDGNCDIKDPFTKAVRSLARLQKQKGGASANGFTELKNNVLNSGVELYQLSINDKKWSKALQTIDVLKELQVKPIYLITQAYCEAQLSKSGVVKSALAAINGFSQIIDKDEAQSFIDQTNTLLLKLDSVKSIDLKVILDTAFSKLPRNNVLDNTVFNFWKNDLTKYGNNNDFENFFNTLNKILKYFPENQLFKDEIVKVVLVTADNLVNNFKADNNKVNDIFSCCNFLYKTRKLLPENMAQQLLKATYFNLRGSAVKYNFSLLSGTTGMQNEFKFSALDNIEVQIFFDALVSKSEMLKINGFYWENAPLNKRAKNAKDIVAKETLNYYLLDSLCHFQCNKFRSENGMSPIKWHNNIYRVSKQHSSTMACIGSAFHGQEESLIYGVSDSISLYKDFINNTAFSCNNENVSIINDINSKTTYNELAKSIVMQWFDNPEQRNIILNSDFVYESISNSIITYSGQTAAFLDNNLVSKYYPEIKKLIEIFPALKDELAKPKLICYTSQHFACK